MSGSPGFPMTLRRTTYESGNGSYWAAKSLSLRAAHVYTGLVSSNGSRLSSLSIPRLPSLSLLCIRDDEVVQDDPESGRRLPRSGFRSHRTGGDSGENKGEKKKKRERSRSRATPGHRWSSPKEICGPSSSSRPDSETVVTVPYISHRVCTYPLASRSHEPCRRLCRVSSAFSLGRVTRRRNPGSRVSPGIVENRISMDSDNVCVYTCEWSLRIAHHGRKGRLLLYGRAMGRAYLVSINIGFYLHKTII